ncbi:MAG: hypothetical protein K0R60_1583, partial [Microbacterium sp.]|nr:hypothetical protein [Microbacterium sp.]
MIPVRASGPQYRVAVAGLPLRVRGAAEQAGAIVVVDGSDGWVARSVAALDAGAAALIVSDPVAAGVEDLGSLAARAGTVPVLIDRPRLRPDVADDVSAVPVAARMLAADVAADAAHVWAAVRDAVGWMRILAGAPLVLR